MAGERSDVQPQAEELIDGLGSPDAVVRRDAVWRGRDLVHRWRGPYGGLIPTLGGRLHDPDPDVRSAAACAFERMYSVAWPAADDLAERVAANVDLWTGADRVRDRIDLQRIAASLARLGDPRAIPSLAANIDGHPRLAISVVLSLGHFRDHAEDFVPGLRRRLARAARTLPEGVSDALLAVTGLRCVAGVRGMPEVLELLRCATTSQSWTLVREALRALAAFGPAGAVADVRPYLTSRQPQIAVHAAYVLSALPAYADAVLPVVLPRLDTLSGEDGMAFAALARLGPAASEVAGRVRELFDAACEPPASWTGGDLHDALPWRRIIDYAVALWHVTGDSAAVLPALIDGWPHGRTVIVDCLAALGPAAAPALPLLRTEVTTPSRYAAPGGLTNLVDRDEALLRTCRAVLMAADPA